MRHPRTAVAALGLSAAALVGLVLHEGYSDRAIIPVKGDVPTLAVGAEVPANTWHTVIALVPGCVLLEVKAGPFDPNQPKDLAPWAPDEGSAAAAKYLEKLIESVTG